MATPFERVKHLNSTLKFDGVNRSIDVSAMVPNDLENSWSLASPWFRAWVLSTKLSNAESSPDFGDNRLEGKPTNPPCSNPGQNRGSRRGPSSVLSWSYPSLRISRQTPKLSDIFVDKNFRDPLPKHAGNLECQPIRGTCTVTVVVSIGRCNTI
jgi:hypothetical protein